MKIIRPGPIVPDTIRSGLVDGHLTLAEVRPISHQLADNGQGSLKAKLAFLNQIAKYGLHLLELLIEYYS